jgi:hypothetical protein
MSVLDEQWSSLWKDDSNKNRLLLFISCFPYIIAYFFCHNHLFGFYFLLNGFQASKPILHP